MFVDFLQRRDILKFSTGQHHFRYFDGRSDKDAYDSGSSQGSSWRVSENVLQHPFLFLTFHCRDKIATNVNTDEAAVLGAALHGASLSRQFKTKNIKVSDIAAHDIQVSYFAAPTSPNTRPRSITTLIFPAGSKVGTKKVLTFKRKEDFSLFLDYKNPVAPGFPTRMLEVDLGNVTEAIANLTERGAADPVVKATLTLSESGFVSVTDAIAYGEIKDESLTGKQSPDTQLKEHFNL